MKWRFNVFSIILRVYDATKTKTNINLNLQKNLLPSSTSLIVLMISKDIEMYLLIKKVFVFKEEVVNYYFLLSLLLIIQFFFNSPKLGYM